MTENNLKAVVEALLFASEKPLSLEEIRKALDNLAPSAVSAAIGELKSEYEQANRGMRIVEIAGGFQMVTASGLAPFLKRLFKARRLERLSKPALETLAIIAYKQPLTRREIEFLRNVNVDGIMKSLLEKDLIRISGRKKTPGRPHVFGTTKQFLEHFGLNSLTELPKMEDFTQLAAKEQLNQAMPLKLTQAEVQDAAGESAQANR
jgi:segregation and condensation protein B